MHSPDLTRRYALGKAGDAGVRHNYKIKTKEMIASKY